jgi:hypothetical protein
MKKNIKAYLVNKDITIYDIEEEKFEVSISCQISKYQFYNYTVATFNSLEKAKKYVNDLIENRKVS